MFCSFVNYTERGVLIFIVSTKIEPYTPHTKRCECINEEIDKFVNRNFLRGDDDEGGSSNSAEESDEVSSDVPTSEEERGAPAEEGFASAHQAGVTNEQRRRRPSTQAQLEYLLSLYRQQQQTPRVRQGQGSEGRMDAANDDDTGQARSSEQRPQSSPPVPSGEEKSDDNEEQVPTVAIAASSACQNGNNVGQGQDESLDILYKMVTEDNTGGGRNRDGKTSSTLNEETNSMDDDTMSLISDMGQEGLAGMDGL